jgi:Flp pilus assembly protein TadD
MTLALCSAAWLALAPAAEAARPKDAVVEEGLPIWMTHGEEVRLEIVSDLLDSKNTGSALDILRSMRSDGFDGPLIDLYQGIALRLDGVTSEAERLLLLAQKRLRGDPRPSSELCLLYADDRRIEEAVEACERAAHVSGGEVEADASVFNNLSFLLLSVGRNDEALDNAEHAVQLDGRDPMLRNNLALAQAAVGREEVAFRTLQSTMSKADAAYMVGLAVDRARGSDAAGPWFDRALEIDPRHPLTLLHQSAVSSALEPGPAVDPEPIGPPKESP